ncbi:MAG TPA: hypothetical protein VF221_03370 [Chloroflexota bacterium]
MKALRYLAAPVFVMIFIAGCGGPDRTALAQQTVVNYWTDVNNAKMTEAYKLLTPGIQQTRPKGQFTQDMFGFLSSVGAIKPTVSKATVNGDKAVVPVYLYFVKQQKTLEAYQHLYWYNDGWRITDENGGVSQTK